MIDEIAIAMYVLMYVSIGIVISRKKYKDFLLDKNFRDDTIAENTFWVFLFWLPYILVMTICKIISSVINFLYLPVKERAMKELEVRKMSEEGYDVMKEIEDIEDIEGD